VTSTNSSHTATATANTPSGGFITGYVVTGGGNGYVTAPLVTVSGGGGAGAAAIAHLTGDVVTSLSVNNPGNGGYTSSSTVTIAPPPANIAYTTFWSNDGSSSAGSEPMAAASVAVTNGLFTVRLGDSTLANMAALPTTLFTQPNLQLRLWFNDGSNGFAALSPVQNLTAAPYANYAYSATTLTTASNQPVNLTVNGTTVLRLDSVEDLRLALDLFYPACLGLWLARQDGSLEVEHLREKLQRQSGMYQRVRALSDDVLQALVVDTCSPAIPCARRLLWQIDASTALLPSAASNCRGLPDDIPEATAIPLLCREACNHFVAACLAAAKAAKGGTVAPPIVSV